MTLWGWKGLNLVVFFETCFHIGQVDLYTGNVVWRKVYVVGVSLRLRIMDGSGGGGRGAPGEPSNFITREPRDVLANVLHLSCFFCVCFLCVLTVINS